MGQEGHKERRGSEMEGEKARKKRKTFEKKK